jgi:hypothetical protein
MMTKRTMVVTNISGTATARIPRWRSRYHSIIQEIDGEQTSCLKDIEELFAKLVSREKKKIEITGRPQGTAMTSEGSPVAL